MTNQEILTRAIEKTITSGWEPTMFSWIPEDYKVLLGYWFTADNYKSVIFNHDFAKALWGEEEDGTEFIKGIYGPQPKYRWKHHLQKMVIADDPIKYLGDNI